MNLLNKIFSTMVQNQANPGDGGAAGGAPSGYGTPEATPPPTPPTNAQGAGGNNQPPPVPPAPQGTPNTPPANSANPAGGQGQPTPPENVTGYGDTPPPPTPPPATPPTPPANAEVPLELDLRGLPEEAPSVKYVRERAKTLGLSKEQAQKLLDAEKVDTDNYAKAQDKLRLDRENERKTIHANWEKELRDDPTFGGANFAQNVHEVNQLISNHLPSVKNRLTTTKERLEPSLMRDLSNVAKLLKQEGKVVNGGAAGGQPEKHSPLDFYSGTKT
jgi:hypothetical protein